jgi:Ser/Thr protein kinase RdoA (MazF antagonist)
MSILPTNVLTRWAELAIQQYPLEKPTLCFLGHSDNITFRVEEPAGAVYLLRLHVPALKYWAGIRQAPEVIASELAWLEVLAAQGGFAVQTPLRSRAGELVTTITVENGAAGDRVIPVTLLTWLEGQHFSAAAPEAPAQVERFGALTARMHAFASGWAPPPGFTRPRYDLDHFGRVFARLLRGVDLGVFSEEISWSLRAASRAILTEIEALPAGPQHWGMVHADLHVGNFLVSCAAGDALIIPIDFSFCGFGHYLFDVSVCLAGGLKPSLAPAFMAGYRSVRPLPEDDMRAVEAYALTGRLSYYAYQIDNPAERTWLQRRIPEVVQNEVSRFLRGENILLV